jgi:hypothetical protein
MVRKNVGASGVSRTAANLFVNVAEALLRERYQQIFDRYELLHALMFADLDAPTMEVRPTLAPLGPPDRSGCSTVAIA